jgi:predicted nucleic acid-binding protein
MPYHSGYVLDASVIAKWFTRHEEPERSIALGLRREYLHGRFQLLIPDLCLVEVANAVRFSPRAREEDVAEALDALRALDLTIRPTDWEMLQKANAIAWAHKTALYDAVYVALAELAGFPLVTADEQLVRSLRGHGIVLRLKELSFPS